jgi:GNAT superfamily N-acetyltransferase
VSNPEFLLRGPAPTDIPFVLNSWLKSARDVGDHASMSNAVYFAGYRNECVAKLETGNVTVACSSEDPDQIYGWLAWTGRVIHYVYVKHPYRRFGLARAMVEHSFPAIGKVPTLVTNVGRFHKDWGRKFQIEYDPYSWMSEHERA